MLRYRFGKVEYHTANPDEGIPPHKNPHDESMQYTGGDAKPAPDLWGVGTEIAGEGGTWTPFTMETGPNQTTTYQTLIGSQGNVMGFGSKAAREAWPSLNPQNIAAAKANPEYLQGIQGAPIYMAPDAPVGHWRAESGSEYAFDPTKGLSPEAFFPGGAGASEYAKWLAGQPSVNQVGAGNVANDTGASQGTDNFAELMKKYQATQDIPPERLGEIESYLGQFNVDASQYTNYNLDNKLPRADLERLNKQLEDVQKSPYGQSGLLDRILGVAGAGGRTSLSSEEMTMHSPPFLGMSDEAKDTLLFAHTLNQLIQGGMGEAEATDMLKHLPVFGGSVQTPTKKFDTEEGGLNPVVQNYLRDAPEEEARKEESKSTIVSDHKHIMGTLAGAFGNQTIPPGANVMGTIDIQKVLNDPGYNNAVSTVANHSIAMPQGWTYSEPSIDPSTGRIVRMGVLSPQDGAVDLSSTEQRQVKEMLDRQFEAQNALSLAQSADISLMDDRLKYQEAALESAAEQKWKSDEAALDRRQDTSDIFLAERLRKGREMDIQNDAQKFTQEVEHVWQSSEKVLDRQLQKDIQGTAAQRHIDAMARDDNNHSNTMLAIAEQGRVERLNITDRGTEDRLTVGKQGIEERKNIQERSLAELKAIEAKGKIETELQEARETGLMERLTEQITSDELLAGNQITSTEAIAKAERELRKSLQDDQIQAAKDNLSTEGTQRIESIQETGAEERLSLIERERIDKARQEVLGTQATEQIQERALEERATLERQFELQQEQIAFQREMPTLDAGANLAQVRSVSSNYTTNLNNAINAAATSGDYSTVNAALAQELPPMPVGVQWDRDAGGFRMRSGFEGRQMDASTREWIAAATSAYKTRDRVEQVVQQANMIQVETQARLGEQRQAQEDFRQHMLTGAIDSAEEAAARHQMAQTASLAAEAKMQHLQMLMNLLQNPVQLGMAKRHGLLGQIEATLGFTIPNVPTGPVGGAGTIPAANEWQTMDSEEQTFSIASYVEQGGTPDEFLRLIAGAAPAQMQQLQYGVL